MHRPATPWRTGWAVALVVFLVPAGCSSGPGNPFSLFPQGHRLTESAKQLRAAYPQPVALPRELDKRVTMPYIVEPSDVLLVQPANLESDLRLPGDQPVLPDGTIKLGTGGEMRFSPFEAMSQRQDTQITWGHILTASVQRLVFWRR